MLPDRVLREVFHFLFLERLLKMFSPDAFVLKGGVNLRFFFQSPRYSEDMDLDVAGVPVHLLRERGYRLIADKAFLRALQTYGIREILTNDPLKAKHTETTQRFRVRIVSQAGEEYPTKIEFSRRGKSTNKALIEDVDRELARKYQRLAFACPHYDVESAASQKLLALAGRAVPQSRDVFDLYVLLRGGRLNVPGFKLKLPSIAVERASEALLSLSPDDFAGQILPFLEEEALHEYEDRNRWDLIQDEVLKWMGRHA